MNKILNMENEETSFIKHAREIRKLESEKHPLEQRPKPEAAIPLNQQTETEPGIEEKKKHSISYFPQKNRRFIRKKTYRRY